MELVLQIFSSIGFFVFIFLIWNRIYKMKQQSLYKVIILLVISMCLMVFIGLLKIPMLNFGYSLFLVLIFNKLLFDVRGKSFIIYDIILLVGMMVVDTLSVTLFAGIMHKELGEILDNIWYNAAAMVLYWILLFISFHLFLFLMSGKDIIAVKSQEFIFFIILVGSEIFLLQFLNDMLLSDKADYKLSILLLIFFMLDIYISYLFYKISEAYKTEKKLQLLTLQSSMQLHAYRELSEKYTHSRRIVHDIKKHLVSLEGLVERNCLEQAQCYQKKMNEELDKLVPVFLCDNPLLSVILNDKMMIAKKRNIEFTVNIEFSELDFIDDLDITIIFSNLIDNALEACSELAEDKRKIYLTVMKHNCFLYIYIENEYKNLQSEKGDFKSTKLNHQGLGLDNIKQAVSKYEGNMHIHTENHKFTVSLLIPVSDEK